ncbi:MAG: glutamine amidotransferase [Gammaproteobacteria bacterium]|nr:glutamine amidotransferase [Gammaproteobacteria bacterium]
MKPCLIIKCGDKIPSLATTPGDYEQWIATGMGLAPSETLVVAPQRGAALPEVCDISGIVITGSGSMVTDGEPWLEQSAAWLREAVAHKVPLLGICFGHQLLAHALGGTVDYNPAGVEVGSITITLQPAARHDPLLGALPARFTAQLSHRQSVRHLPEGARLLASSAMDPHQAFGYGESAWGLQFHPEFDPDIIAHFIDFYREQLRQEGQDAARLQAARAPSPQSHALLARFATLIRSQTPR